MSFIQRRGLLLAAGGLLAATALPRRVLAQAAAPTGPFTLPDLSYAAGANEAAIDARTMEIHHGFHHRAYVTNLNNAVAQQPQLGSMQLDEILMRLSQVPENIRTVVRNNAGGHANHSMFWEIMGGQGGAPEGELAAAITRDFEGFDQFKTRFEAAANGQFGAGWAFLTAANDGKLAIVAKPNQDTPLMDGVRVLMGNDVWEHAYYLRYQNRRAEYTRNWWNVVNWAKVGERYAAAKAGTLRI
ncbi:superoxide dismutase [Plastoroseomonas hellenica]|uniref:superoxide dismutase n=1 Tax=Plastoroseomonas hellenica TaxID=2687306 RepID=UPI001BA5DA00|nr:superoxide dismutase [Plastoroseomonas hellenica]MBR0642906.1 superoxide dismutase [Plastoroseomonas hellenica]